MDKNLFLERIHKNLDSSMEERKNLYAKIFKEYYRKIATEGGVRAEEFLCSKIGVLGQEFRLFYIAMALELKETNQEEAAKIMELAGQSYLNILNDFIVSRVHILAQEAKATAKELIKRYHQNGGVN